MREPRHEAECTGLVFFFIIVIIFTSFFSCLCKFVSSRKLCVSGPSFFPLSLGKFEDRNLVYDVFVSGLLTPERRKGQGGEETSE